MFLAGRLPHCFSTGYVQNENRSACSEYRELAAALWQGRDEILNYFTSAHAVPGLQALEQPIKSVCCANSACERFKILLQSYRVFYGGRAVRSIE